MKIFIKLSIVVFLIFAAAVFYFQKKSENFLFPSDSSSRISTVATTTFLSEEQLLSIQKIKEVSKKISTPPPLEIVEKFVAEEVFRPQTDLTSLGVIVWTNTERAINGFPPLKENEKLKAAAEAKLNDMFLKQYFAHVSPEGFGQVDLMKDAGYEFIAGGENLAMGVFEGDKKLVDAWMNSPGHRANILNPRFEEIGVAVAKGIFKNREIWLAVQEFGLPLSACSQPEPDLKIQIDQTQNQINDLKNRIEEKIRELKSEKFNSQSEYNQKIGEYNDLVNQYGGLIETIKSLITDYNNQVNDFNFCLNG
ncbi:MAG: CAP domain-containing protein, partial [Patescibacteria group bacterium]